MPSTNDMMEQVGSTGIRKVLSSNWPDNRLSGFYISRIVAAPRNFLATNRISCCLLCFIITVLRTIVMLLIIWKCYERAAKRTSKCSERHTQQLDLWELVLPFSPDWGHSPWRT